VHSALAEDFAQKSDTREDIAIPRTHQRMLLA
jgi:hypothetical protein